MYNDLFSIGPLTFHMYGLMTAIGIIAAYALMGSQAKKKHFSEEQSGHIIGLIAFCVIFGYIGSKFLYMLTILPQLLEDPSLFRRSLSDGWVVFGGLLGGMFGAWVFCRWKKLNVGKYFDLAFPAVALAQGFGRIGCFFAGCCYGVETESHFSIVFKNSQYAPNHVHLVPTQLISSALDFLLCLFLLRCDKRKQKRDGELAALYLILYSAGRFVLEFWRGDLERGAVGVLSTSQFIGVFTFLVGVILFIKIRMSGRPSAVEEAESAETAETAETTRTEKTKEDNEQTELEEDAGTDPEKGNENK